MALRPQPISWNLTGGLSGDTNPLSVQPGSHLRLDDVKQERADEWRARQGFDAVTMSPGPVQVGAKADGGLAYLADADGDVMRFYDSGTSTTSYGASLRDRPANWTRYSVNYQRSTGAASSLDVAVTPTAVAVKNAFVFPHVLTFFRKSTMEQIAPAVTLLSTTNYARVAALGSLFVVVMGCTDGTTRAVVYDSAGNQQRSDTISGAGGHATVSWVDVMYYTGSTITIVARTAANQIRFIEYNPSTGSTATANLVIAVTCDNWLSLLSEPDGSGVRYIAVSNTSPSTRVLRVTSAGAVTADEQAEAIASTSMAGVAYTNGTEWQIVYQTAGGPKACKKSTTIGAAAFVGGAARTDLALKGNAWREPGTDPMRVIMGINVTAAAETQRTYLEFTFSFTGGNTVTTREEPQSVILPLDAWVDPFGGEALPHVVRDSSRSFWTALYRRATATEIAGASAAVYVPDVWHIEYPASAAANVGALSVGRPLECAGALWFPSGALFAAEPGPCPIHGVPFFPRSPTLVQSTVGGAGLTLLATYQYVEMLEIADQHGRVWRSPLSEPASITLTGANNTVTATYDPRTMPCLESQGLSLGIQPRSVAAKLFRTAGNGSVFQLVSITYLSSGTGAVATVDSTTDIVLAGNDFLYTYAELETAITPRPAYLATYGDRLWMVNADFRTELWFSKHIRPGHQPEFVGEFVIDFDDEFGDITGIAQLDDKLVVFKKNAIYLVAGDGPEDNGSGSLHSTARVSMDVGAIIGPPTLSTGEEVFFVSERGIFSIDRSARVAWIGSPVDDFFCQPTVRTPIVVTDIVFSRAKNEVRFLYSGGQLVYDRKHQIWYRWTGGLSGYALSAIVSGNQMLFKSDGALTENATSTTDAGTTYRGTIRSAWVRAGQFGTQMRLYRAFVTGAQVGTNTGVAPKLTIFQNNSDDPVQAFEAANPFPSTETPIQAEARPGHGRQNCAAFSLQIELPPSDSTWRLEQWGAVVGVRGGAEKRPATERWT